ncbi:MAG: bifunctional metallophosphatase/5'-nucleotidase [Sulfuricella sp.]|jgi:5'-nucleotidase
MHHVIKPLAIALLLAFNANAHATCMDERGTVFTGAINSGVVNKPVAGSCLNDLIVDSIAEGANWGSHGEFVATLSRQSRHWQWSRLITEQERSRLMQAAARSDVGNTMLVTIAAFNDFHGNLQSPGTYRNTSNVALPSGGIDYLAAYVRNIRAKSPNSVTVSAGDLIGASPLTSALFHDEPTIEGMNILGLDFNAVGNHEFDEGRDELLRMQNGGCHPTDINSCKGELVGTPYPFEGAKFNFLAANVVEKSDGETLFPAYGIKNFKGNKVAFIGMTLKGTPSIVTPSGISTLEFRDEADTVNALIPRLEARGVKAVVVLIHEGGVTTGNYTNCPGISGPIADIVSRLDNAVDLVISGHTHQAYLCNLPNSAGRAIPVTSAGNYGRLVSEIELTLNTATRDVIEVNASNLIVDRTPGVVTPVDSLTTLVSNYAALAAPIANQALGNITAAITRTMNAGGESALGDVIADAQLESTAPAELGGAVIAFMNPGGLRADFSYPASAAGEGDGVVTYGEAFTVQPFGNSLVTKTLTGQQIYDLLEQQWGAIQPYSRILQVSGGFGYQHTFDTTAANFAAQKGGHFVCDGSVKLNGVAIDKLASYRVTMNSFLASGGDNFSVFNLGLDQLGGALDLDSMQDYFTAHSPVAPGQQNRIVKAVTCPAAI